MPEINRRTALKSGLACAAFAALPRVVRAALEPTAVLGRYVIRIAQNSELAATNGSKIFSVPGVTGAAGEIVVTRTAGSTFSALSAFCTHEGCQVSPYNPSTQRIPCQCHGSEFRLDGSVARAPAQRPLQRYTATFDTASNSVFVEIPEFVGAEEETAVPALRLDVAGPNPAAGEVRLRYTLPTEGPARLSVYDARGRLMIVLADDAHPAGAHSVTWDARASAPGVYLVRLVASGEVRTRAVTVSH